MMGQAGLIVGHSMLYLVQTPLRIGLIRKFRAMERSALEILSILMVDQVGKLILVPIVAVTQLQQSILQVVMVK